jgi:hypothetical protein
MEELHLHLQEKNINKLTEFIENHQPDKGFYSEDLPLFSTFLIQKAGFSASPQTIAWLHFLTQEFPVDVRSVSENFPECLQNLQKRCPRTEKLYILKGKLGLFCNSRAEAPDMSTATPEQLQWSEEESSEGNYQEFSVLLT